ncbi:MAG: YggW family oxidoreductase, partial [Candidatus Thioglobus sp.]|nr:YggW family oxidoreductase [Candidatus Thioglobus sp.]
MLKPLKLLPLSLYIHYPWCVKKCPYCDFNSHKKSDETGYISALLTDLQADLK